MNARSIWSYREFYNSQPPSDSLAFIRKYPTDIIILYLSKINALIFLDGDSNLSTLKKILLQCFPFLDNKRRNRLAELMKDSESLEDGSHFFSPQAISKLIGICLSNYRAEYPDEEADESNLQNDLWDNILLANQIYYDQLTDSDDICSYSGIWKLGMMQQFYIRRFIVLHYIGNVEVLLFYKFIRREIPNGSRFIGEFIQNLGLSDFFQYAKIVMKILKQSMDQFKEDENAKWSLELNEQQQKIIEPFSYRRSNLPANNDEFTIHKHIMTHPIYFILDEHPVILDFNFLSYIAELSLTYNFHKHTSIREEKRWKTFGDFKGWLGKKYYEEFVSELLLKGMFKEPEFILWNDKEGSPIDFMIVNDRDIYLIEVKSSDLPRIVLEEIDENGFKDFLDKNFASSKENGLRNFGVCQIAKALDDIANSNKYDSLLTYPTKKRKHRIYPIIIHTEKAIDIAGVNSYLQDVFENEAKNITEKFDKIHPVTLISISTLIEKMAVIKENPHILKEWIRSYWRRCSSNKKSFKRSGDPNQFYNSCNTFGDFLRVITKDYPTRESFRTLVTELDLDPISTNGFKAS